MGKGITVSSPEFAATFSRFESLLRERLLAAYKARQPLYQVERDIFTLLQSENLTAGLRRSLERQVRAARREVILELRDQFVDTHTIADSSSITPVLTDSLRIFGRVEQNIQTRLVETISRAFTEHLPLAEVENLVAARLGVERSSIATVVRTGMATVARATTMATAIDAGVTEFMYDGPGAQRDFCRRHLGKVYTSEEIDGLDNGQALSVRTSCGGYGCVHRWRPVVRRKSSP